MKFLQKCDRRFLLALSVNLVFFIGWFLTEIDCNYFILKMVKE